MALFRDFRDKLRHNYHELTTWERASYRLFLRARFSKEERFFFEGLRDLPGQMYIADRKGLYGAITRFRPRYCLEVGTASGGGSTYFLARAFEALGEGKVYTLESNREAFERASAYYHRRLPSLARFVEFGHGSRIEVFQITIESFGGLDACFLDGADDRDETVHQYEYLRPFMRPGAILMAHDWNTEKMASLKPLIGNDGAWEPVETIDQPESVGFAIFRRRPSPGLSAAGPPHGRA